MIENGQRRRLRSRQLSLSEIMTITVAFHLSPYKNFKNFSLKMVSKYWRGAFLMRVYAAKAFVLLSQHSLASYADAGSDF